MVSYYVDVGVRHSLLELNPLTDPSPDGNSSGTITLQRLEVPRKLKVILFNVYIKTITQTQF